MIGAWLEDGRLAVRDDLPEPRPGAGEAGVRVIAAGICGTDLELLRGYRPFRGVPGHEFVGRVDEGPDEWLGARVAAEINVTCRSGTSGPVCVACGAGRAAHCRRRSVVGISGRDGVFAERVALPLSNLHRVPDAVSDIAAVFIEPLAAAFRILEQVKVTPADRALVVGPGRLGQLVARVLATTGCEVAAAGRSGRGLARIAERGVDAFGTPDVPPGEFDVAVDCTGDPDGFRVAQAAVRPGGTLVLKSTYGSDLTLDASALAVDEISVLGSRCGPFPTAIEALRDGTVEVEDLVDDRLPLAETALGFARAAESGVMKVLLMP